MTVLLAGCIALALGSSRFRGRHRGYGRRREVQHPGGGGESRRTGGTLKGPGPFTVFAPTDEAFAKLPPGTLENLLKPENKAKLQKHPHLPRGGWQGDGERRGEAPLRQDRWRAARITIKAVNGGVMVNDAHIVIKTDIAAEQRRDSRHRHGDSCPNRYTHDSADRSNWIYRRPPADGAWNRQGCRSGACAGIRRRCAWRVAPGTEVVRGDLLQPASLGSAFSGVDTAFYLVHSMQ